jgi:PAS domain S-box-containing protein
MGNVDIISKMPIKDYLSKTFGNKAASAEEHSTRVRLELALEAAGMADWDFDYEKNTAHRSPLHDQLYGYEKPLDHWNFDNFYFHVLPEFHAELREKFDALPSSGKIEAEFKILRVDGEVRWLSMKGKSQKDSNGKLLRIAGVLKDVTVEKLAFEKARTQQRNFISLFEKSNEFFCVLDHDLIYEYQNTSHVELMDKQNMVGKPIDQSNDSEVLKIFKTVLKTGETAVFREAPVLVLGKERFVDMILAPRRNEAQEIDGVFVLGSDITEKIEAIRAAKKSEAHMRLITDKLPAFVSYTDKEGRYQFMNKMYETWFQKPISEMLGKTREEITPFAYSKDSKPFEARALSGEATHQQGTIVDANGKTMNLDINFVSDVDPDTNEIRGMIAVGVDTTSQTQALRDAELARKELHDIFMQAPAPMCLLTGPDLVFTMANPLYVQLIRREVLGKKLADVFSKEDISLYSQIIEQVYQSGEAYFINQAPAEFYNEKGETFKKYMNVGYHAYLDLEGKPKGVLVIIQDVTDQVLSVQARDNFMGIASHELKTPLTAMKLQMQMNQKMLEYEGVESFGAEALKKIFSRSINQVDRLTRLVDDMLDMSRISSDKLRMHFTQVDLSHLVKETVQSFAPQLQEVGIELHLNLQENIVLSLDEARMDQVITNLLTNVIRYAPSKPLHIDLRTQGDQAILSVKDQGIGIHSKYHETIFERFERGTATRDISGMGLGLYISRNIIESHRGTITVRSEPGLGSEFVITLPLKRPS